jgi:hypothetical protein
VDFDCLVAIAEMMMACLEVMEICLEKMEATMKAGQEQMRAKIKNGMEKMKATESEAIAEHYEWEPCVKATHLPTALQDWAPDELHGAPRGVMYGETIRVLEDQFGDQHLATEYCNHLKTRTHGDG